jgi:hypothetical protein
MPGVLSTWERLHERSRTLGGIAPPLVARTPRARERRTHSLTRLWGLPSSPQECRRATPVKGFATVARTSARDRRTHRAPYPLRPRLVPGAAQRETGVRAMTMRPKATAACPHTRTGEPSMPPLAAPRRARGRPNLSQPASCRTGGFCAFIPIAHLHYKSHVPYSSTLIADRDHVDARRPYLSLLYHLRCAPAGTRRSRDSWRARASAPEARGGRRPRPCRLPPRHP